MVGGWIAWWVCPWVRWWVVGGVRWLVCGSLSAFVTLGSGPVVRYTVPALAFCCTFCCCTIVNTYMVGSWVVVGRWGFLLCTQQLCFTAVLQFFSPAIPAPHRHGSAYGKRAPRKNNTPDKNRRGRENQCSAFFQAFEWSPVLSSVLEAFAVLGCDLSLIHI